MAIGWLDIGENRYYFNDNGVMQTGWLSWSGDWYYLGDDGALYVSRKTPDGTTVDENGKAVTTG